MKFIYATRRVDAITSCSIELVVDKIIAIEPSYCSTTNRTLTSVWMEGGTVITLMENVDAVREAMK